MDWAKLLSTDRQRPSQKYEKEARTEFQRDFGRAVFCTPVRRLQDKAQVFPLEPLDAVRTRLTHSLEVSSIARDLADAVGRTLLKQKKIENLDIVESIKSIAATCGLLHDLGNPPFGHAGEGAIQEWFKRCSTEASGFFEGLSDRPQYKQDFLKFNGNAHTLRLVARLQVLADSYGLNLTYGTLSALQKYVAASDGLDGEKREKKTLGHFASENDLVEHVRDATGTGPARNPIAFLVEASDDIAYLTADIEDGVKKQVIDWAGAKQELLRTVPDADGPVAKAIEAAEKQIEPGAARLARGDRDEACATAFRVQAIARMVPAAAESFIRHYEAIMNGGFHGDLLEKSDAASLELACRELCVGHVYRSKETLRLEIMGRRVIQDLMDLFWDGVKDWSPSRTLGGFARDIYELCSPNYRQVFEDAVQAKRMPERYCKLQLVTDYVAGMTDTFACDLHRRLTNG